MIKFYGSMMCSDTVYADKVLRRNKVEVEYIDMVSNLKKMKEFLKYRDTRKEFEQIKLDGKIGIPMFLLEDGSIEFDVTKLPGVTDDLVDDTEENNSGAGMCQF